MTEGISKDELLEINPWGYETQQDLLNAILELCTELDPWMTIDEFKNSGFVGLCWILKNGREVCACTYDGEYFINPHMPSYPLHEDSVHRVMPIKKPDSPNL